MKKNKGEERAVAASSIEAWGKKKRCGEARNDEGEEKEQTNVLVVTSGSLLFRERKARPVSSVSGFVSIHSLSSWSSAVARVALSDEANCARTSMSFIKSPCGRLDIV